MAASEYQAGEYQRLEIKQYPSRSLRETAEGKYWRRFKAPIVAQQVCHRHQCTATTQAAHPGRRNHNFERV